MKPQCLWNIIASEENSFKRQMKLLSMRREKRGGVKFCET